KLGLAGTSMEWSHIEKTVAPVAQAAAAAAGVAARGDANDAESRRARTFVEIAKNRLAFWLLTKLCSAEESAVLFVDFIDRVEGRASTHAFVGTGGRPKHIIVSKHEGDEAKETL